MAEKYIEKVPLIFGIIGFILCNLFLIFRDTLIKTNDEVLGLIMTFGFSLLIFLFSFQKKNKLENYKLLEFNLEITLMLTLIILQLTEKIAKINFDNNAFLFLLTLLIVTRVIFEYRIRNWVSGDL